MPYPLGDGTFIGRARLTPDAPVVAGSIGEWSIVYTVGRSCFDDGGALRLSWRFASDWSEPQFTDPAAPSHLAVTTDGVARLDLRYDARGNVRPWMRTVRVRVVDGFLREAETIRFVWRQARVQTFRETRFRFRLFVDPFGTDLFQEVPDDLGFPVIAAAAETIRVHGPSHAITGDSIVYHVAFEDRWGNPAAPPDGAVTLVAEDGASIAMARATEPTATLATHAPAHPGIARATAKWGDETSVPVNPLEISANQPEFRPFWGDLHGQSGETIGSGTVEEYFAYARDVAGVDFAAHQGNDFQVTPAIWAEIRRQTAAFHAPGQFVTFLGIEWSAITAAGGDHNVLYRGDDGPLHRTSHWQVEDRTDATSDAYPIDALYLALAGFEDVMLVPHIGGRRADLAWHDPHLERLIEIHSCWGTFEWFRDEAMRRGLRVGFTAGSDDHKGRPGAAAPGSGSFAVRGGLTCAWAGDLTREALWEALRARRTSCTTGARIIARLRTGDGYWMGAEVAGQTHAPTLQARVIGLGPLAEVTIQRGTETVYRHDLGTRPSHNAIRVAWRGARILDRNRQQVWDGWLRIEGALVRQARGYALDEPNEAVTVDADGLVRWRSRTAGDEDGVDLLLDDASRGTLTFVTDLCSFTLDLANLVDRHEHRAGGVDRAVVVERLPAAPGPAEVAFAWTDPSPLPQWNAYHLRAKQTDGQIAWTSPIFVEIAPRAGEAT